MKWSEVCSIYSNKWIVFYIVDQYKDNDFMIIKDVEIISEFEDLNRAFKYYCQFKRKNKGREIGIYNTQNENLVYKIVNKVPLIIKKE